MYVMKGDPLDECLELVADRNRRRIIQHLRNVTEREVDIDTLIDHLHDGEPISVAERPSRTQTSIQLHHDHLPKLEYHGVIEYESEREVVRYRSDAEIESILDSLQEHVHGNAVHISI